MREKVVPMIHVPDVRATVEWYQGARDLNRFWLTFGCALTIIQGTIQLQREESID